METRFTLLGLPIMGVIDRYLELQKKIVECESNSAHYATMTTAYDAVLRENTNLRTALSNAENRKEELINHLQSRDAAIANMEDEIHTLVNRINELEDELKDEKADSEHKSTFLDSIRDALGSANDCLDSLTDHLRDATDALPED